MESIVEYLKRNYGYAREGAWPVSVEVECAFAMVLQGQQIYQVGHYRVCSAIEDSVLIVMAYAPELALKYIHARGEGAVTDYFVAMPQSWCDYHYGIKARIELARGVVLDPELVAGGYVFLDTGIPTCSGKSLDFGEADHALAQQHFRRVFS